MPLQRARRLPPTSPSGSPSRPTGVIYRQQYVRCGKAGCHRCPPHGRGHGPYWYGFYWDYRQRTRSFYVGKTLPAGVDPILESTQEATAALPPAVPAPPGEPTVPIDTEGGDAPDLP